MSLYILGTQLRPCLSESPESSMALKNIGFGVREMYLGSPSLLLITSQITLFISSESCFDTIVSCVKWSLNYHPHKVVRRIK